MIDPKLAALKNPGLQGETPFDTVVYAAPGLVYPAAL